MDQSGDNGVTPDTVLIVFFVFFVGICLLIGFAGDGSASNEVSHTGLSDRAAAAECCRLIAVHIFAHLVFRRRNSAVRDPRQNVPRVSVGRSIHKC